MCEDEILEEQTEDAENSAKEETSKADEAVDNTEEVQDLTQKLKESDDKYLRLLAEYDNYRKRTSKEKIEAYGDATNKCIAEILPVLDSLERALEAECKDNAFKDGMNMIHSQFTDVLNKIGVSEIEAYGNEFDPNIHNAIKKIDDEEFGENTICEVFQKGYMLKDKVIRHAVVAVAN